MILNVLVLLGVLTAFWISVNLIDTLYILVALTPVTLFVFNKGLGGNVNCNPEY